MKIVLLLVISIFISILAEAQRDFLFTIGQSVQVADQNFTVVEQITKGIEGSQIYKIKSSQNGKIYLLKINRIKDQFDAAVFQQNSELIGKTQLEFFPVAMDKITLNNREYVLSLLPRADFLLSDFNIQDKTSGEVKSSDRIKRAYSVLVDLLNDLAVLAKFNITHTDIKPENIGYSFKHHKFSLIDYESLFKLQDSLKLGYLTSDEYAAPETLYPGELTIWSVFYQLAYAVIEALDSQHMIRNNLDRLDQGKLNELIHDLQIQSQDWSAEEKIHFEFLRQFISAAFEADVKNRYQKLKKVFQKTELEKQFVEFEKMTLRSNKYLADYLEISNDDGNQEKNEKMTNRNDAKSSEKQNQCLRLFSI